MGLLNNLFGKNEDNKLFQLSNFAGNYNLTVNNELTMGKANPAISLQTTSRIQLTQSLEEKNIHTSITTENIAGSTASEIMKQPLQQTLALASISKKIDFIRNQKGKITGIANKTSLESEWLFWKKNSLPELYPTEIEQEKFAKNYEKGIEVLEESLHENLHYFLLMPDIYHIQNYVTQNRLNSTSPRILKSKLVDGMPIKYVFATSEVKNKEHAVIGLKAEILNEKEIKAQYLSKLYQAQREFKIEDYDFTIDVAYLIEPKSGKIISGNLFLKEKMHDHLQYILEMDLKIATNENLADKQPDTKKPKRNFLSDDIPNL